MQSCGADTGNATARTESDIVHPVLQQLRLLIDEMALLKDDLRWSKKHANISMTFFFFFTRAHRSVVSQVDGSDGSVWSNTSRFSKSLGFPTWPLSGCTHSLESIRSNPHFGFW